MHQESSGSITSTSGSGSSSRRWSAIASLVAAVVVVVTVACAPDASAPDSTKVVPDSVPKPSPLEYSLTANYDTATTCTCCDHGYACDTMPVNTPLAGTMTLEALVARPAGTLEVTDGGTWKSTTPPTADASVEIAFCAVEACGPQIVLFGNAAGDSIFGRVEYVVASGQRGQRNWGRFVARRR
jgi:hypothetical protein